MITVRIYLNETLRVYFHATVRILPCNCTYTCMQLFVYLNATVRIYLIAYLVTNFGCNCKISLAIIHQQAQQLVSGLRQLVVSS